MRMKMILVPTENHHAIQSALETALLLARHCDSYIEGFGLRSVFKGSDSVDIGISIPLGDIPEEAKQEQQIFESFMQEHQVPRSTGATGSLSFGWLDDAPEGESLSAVTVAFST